MADSPEIWCRCDGGPHGFLSIAAHAHADALSVEVRCDGVDILADPGTYCYHGEPEWRKYFQSTIGHNTVEVGGQWQSVRGGAFLWLRHAAGQEISVTGLDDGAVASWMASHDGYRVLRPAIVHRRTVRLDRSERMVEITDVVDGAATDVRVAFHLGPAVTAEFEDGHVVLDWPAGTAPGRARLELPKELIWSLHIGDADPILGWYSNALGVRVPAVTILGSGRSSPVAPLVSRLKFVDPAASSDQSAAREAV